MLSQFTESCENYFITYFCFRMTEIQDTSQTLVPPPPPPEPVFHLDVNATPNIPVIQLTPETMPKLRKVEKVNDVSQEHIDPNPQQSFKDKLNNLLSRRVSEINENEIRLKAPPAKPRTSLPSNIESQLNKEETKQSETHTTNVAESVESTTKEVTTESATPSATETTEQTQVLNDTSNEPNTTTNPSPAEPTKEELPPLPPPTFNLDSPKEQFPSMMGGMVQLTPETMPKLRKVEFKGEEPIEDSQPHMNLNDFKNKLNSLLSPRVSEINDNEIRLAKKESEKALAESVKTDPTDKAVLVPSNFDLNDTPEIENPTSKPVSSGFEAQLFKLYEKSSSEAMIPSVEETVAKQEDAPMLDQMKDISESHQVETTKMEPITENGETQVKEENSIQISETTVTNENVVESNNNGQMPLQTNEIELESLPVIDEEDEKGLEQCNDDKNKESQENMIA